MLIFLQNVDTKWWQRAKYEIYRIPGQVNGRVGDKVEYYLLLVRMDLATTSTVVYNHVPCDVYYRGKYVKIEAGCLNNQPNHTTTFDCLKVAL